MSRVEYCATKKWVQTLVFQRPVGWVSLTNFFQRAAPKPCARHVEEINESEIDQFIHFGFGHSGHNNFFRLQV